MISGGNATVFVSNMDAAVAFYTGILGMKLTNRFGDDWQPLRPARVWRSAGPRFGEVSGPEPMVR